MVKRRNGWRVQQVCLTWIRLVIEKEALSLQLLKNIQRFLINFWIIKVLAWYALNINYEAMSKHLAHMYGLDLSSAKISAVTDKLLALITKWRKRLLQSVDFIIFLDVMHFKVWVENKVTTKIFYSILAVNQEDRKDILGLCLKMKVLVFSITCVLVALKTSWLPVLMALKAS